MKPTKNGIYVTLAYEWIGFEKDKPEKPTTNIRFFDAETGWQKNI